MKRIIFILGIQGMLLNACFAQSTNWDLNLNTITGTLSPNFGTSSNHSLKFFTNNTLKMELGTNGVLKINGLAGTGNRFLFADGNGNIGDTGWPGGSDHFLNADGTWQNLSGASAFSLISGKLSIPLGQKFGIGVSNPITELDILGNSQISNSFGVGKSLYLGPDNDYGMINYIPATPTSPAILNFGVGGQSNGGSNPKPWTVGEHPEDPQPDFTCIQGQTALPNVVVFQNAICVKKMSQCTTCVNSVLGNINIGHNGNNGFIETQGTNLNNPNAGDLYINSRCNRNIYAFDHQTPFAVSEQKVMSIDGRLNVRAYTQIGNYMAAGFQYWNTALYVYPQANHIGIKVRHVGGPGIKLVGQRYDSDTAFTSHRGTALADGTVRFSILGDGKTQINTTNQDALVVSDASIPNLAKFSVGKSGDTYISTSMGIGTLPQANTILNIFAPNGSPATNVLNVGSINVPNALSINPNGIATFNVIGSSGSIFKIKNQGNDLFAIRHDGVAYARELVITMQAFPDYVFSHEYKLPTIIETKNFIQNNHRLPGMPSANEIEKNGATVGEIQRVTIEKLEEAYLYIFQLEARLALLEKQK